MTSACHNCFLCAEAIHDEELNLSSFVNDSFIFRHVLGVPHLQCTKNHRIDIRYCSHCLVKIRNIQNIHEEIERLEKEMEQRKYEIKLKLKESIGEPEKLQKPVMDLRNEVVYELGFTSVFSVIKNMYRRRSCKKLFPRLSFRVMKNVTILKIDPTGKDTETLLCTSIPKLEFPDTHLHPDSDSLLMSVTESNSNITSKKISDPLEMSTENVASDFIVEEKFLPDVHDIIKDENVPHIPVAEYNKSFLENLLKEQSSLIEGETKKSFICGVCGKFFGSYNLLIEHDKLHPINNHTVKIDSNEIPECSSKYPQHKAPSKCQQKCKECGKLLSSSGALQYHMMRIHFETSLYNGNLCKICKCVCKNSHDLEIHMSTHPNEIKFQCHVCQKYCKTKTVLEMHEKTHVSVKQFQCHVCPKQFVDKIHLTYHLVTHTGPKSYSCRFCKKNFRVKRHLTSHLRTHTGDKPFQCKSCSSGFSQAVNLKRHERIHTGEKPYSCKFCVLSFSDPSGLRSHEGTHTSVKPFQCKICCVKFRRRTHLREHELVHNVGKSKC